MKKLLYLILLLPLWATAQTNGTLQMMPDTTLRGLFGSRGTALIPTVSALGTNGYIPVYNGATKKYVPTNPSTLIPTISTGTISNGGTTNGISYNAGVIRLHKVTGTTGGVLTEGADTIGGAKRFTGNLTLSANSPSILGVQGTSVGNMSIGTQNSNALILLTDNTNRLNISNNGTVSLSSLSAGGIVKASGAPGALSIATAGTDYLTPTGSGSGLSGVVLLTGAQTVAGLKTFSSTVGISGGNSLQIESGTTGNSVFINAPAGMASSKTITLPDFTSTLYGTGTGSITSAQLATSLTDETGTGSAVFSESPTFTGTVTAPNLYLPNTTSSITGVFYKDGIRWMHNYNPAGKAGGNLFTGLGSGNFSMTGPASDDASFITAYGDSTATNITKAYGVTVYGKNAGRENRHADAMVAIGPFSQQNNKWAEHVNSVGWGSFLNLVGDSLNHSIGGDSDAFGFNGGRSKTGGRYSLYLGHNAGFNALQKVDAVNDMALGANTYTTADNQFVYGDGNVLQQIFPAGKMMFGFTAGLGKVSVNGGAHIGGESDAGDNNLLVDGTIGAGGTITQQGGSMTNSIKTGQLGDNPTYGGITFNGNLATAAGIQGFFSGGGTDKNIYANAPGGGNLVMNTGTVIAVTQAANDNSTKVATTAYVDGKVASGTYTPTLTGVANVASSSANLGRYTRIGQNVTMHGHISVTPSVTATNTSIRLSLPIGATLGSTTTLSGSGSARSGGDTPVFVIADTVNNEALLYFTSTDTSAHGIEYSYSYTMP